MTSGRRIADVSYSGASLVLRPQAELPAANVEELESRETGDRAAGVRNANKVIIE